MKLYCIRNRKRPLWTSVGDHSPFLLSTSSERTHSPLKRRDQRFIKEIHQRDSSKRFIKEIHQDILPEAKHHRHFAFARVRTLFGAGRASNIKHQTSNIKHQKEKKTTSWVLQVLGDLRLDVSQPQRNEVMHRSSTPLRIHTLYKSLVINEVRTTTPVVPCNTLESSPFWERQPFVCMCTLVTLFNRHPTTV